MADGLTRPLDPTFPSRVVAEANALGVPVRLLTAAEKAERDALIDASIEEDALAAQVALDREHHAAVAADPVQRAEYELLTGAPFPPWEGIEREHERIGFKPFKLAGYLADVRAFLCRYIAFPSEHEPVAIALWLAHAHIVDKFEVSPPLAVTSAEKRSGKTRTLDCLELLVPNPIRMVTPSEAVVYTVLAREPRPTLLLDEVDAIFGPRTAERYEGLRAILNAGNRQGTPVLRVRMDGRKREVDEFDVFGPKVLAGIGNLPDTVADRAIPIRMKRRAQTETIARFRTRDARAEAEKIVFRRQLVPDVPDVPVPDELNDRAADSWEPLLQIAELAGGEWPALARLAAITLSAEEEVPLSVGMRLLADIRDVFENEEQVPTSELLRRLHDLDDAPWGDWYGKPLTARGLAKLLDPYRVSPVQKRLRGEKSRGYFRTDFLDAWDRYVPLVPEGTGTSGTSGTEMAVEDDYPPSAWRALPDEEPDPPSAFDEVMS